MLYGVTLGTIQVFPYGNLPDGWMECDGRELPINQYMALFSLLGDRYGGDGRKTMRLPDLRGRVAVGAGPLLAHAAQAGTEKHTLGTAEIPGHHHVLFASSQEADTERPAGALPGTVTMGSVAPYAPQATRGNLTPMASDTLRLPPSPQPHENRQPYLVMVYAMAVRAEFPMKPHERP